MSPQLELQESAKLPFERTSVLCLSRDNRTAIVFGDECGIVFSIPRVEQIGIVCFPATVISACVTTDGTRLAAVCSDIRIRIWDLRSRQQVREFDCPLSDVVDCGIDGNNVLTLISQQGEIQSMELATGKGLPSFFGGHPGKQEVRLDREGAMVVGVAGDGKATLIDLETGMRVGPSFPHFAPMSSLSISPNSELLATVLPDSSVRIFALPDASNESNQEILLRLQTLTGKCLDENTPRILSNQEWRDFHD
ncbi:WD40 repeat domain-containing protein [Thalassoroseus pseudoceratinae]|uniref:WD40 repeat domain-containing protein n=1 Tax=Thalassoroseus pseudoceratinae TaxID=2713176 RepID=UPI001F0DE0EB|nr:hypothetical protein [Thalassoroseus pseudoceratinae]